MCAAREEAPAKFFLPALRDQGTFVISPKKLKARFNRKRRTTPVLELQR
jgi:hypothetical protein